MIEQGLAHEVAIGRTVYYIEGGRLHHGELLSCSQRKCRIKDANGIKRKLELGKIVAANSDAEPAGFISQASELAQKIDMENLWRLANNEELPANELASRLPKDASAEMKLAAMQLAHARERAFFTVAGQSFIPVDEEKYQKICVARSKQRERRQLEAGFDEQLAGGSLPKALEEVLRRHLEGEGVLDDPDGRYLRRYCKHNEIDLSQLALMHRLVTDPVEIFLGEARGQIPPPVDARIGDCSPNTDGLKLLSGEGFAMDSADTSEVDDAFACAQLADGSYEVAVCISAPGLGLPAPALAQAAKRMVTVYLPGEKHPMLPDEAISTFTLEAPKHCPVIALVHGWDGERRVGAPKFKVAKLAMCGNLAVERFENDLTHPELAIDSHEATILGNLQKFSALVKGQPARSDRDRGHLVNLEGGKPRVQNRADFAVADDLVANLMVHYNGCAARFMLERGYPFIGRKEGRCVVAGKGRHKDVSYGWFSSPLRRIVDLYNQRQMIAALEGRAPVHDADELHSLLPSFEKRYSQAQSMQQKLEQYWAIVWLQSQPAQKWKARALKTPGRVKLDAVPLTAKVDNLGLEVDAQLEIEIIEFDSLHLRIHARLA